MTNPTSEQERTVEERLQALEHASDERRAELRAVLDDLPHAVSRRALVAAAAKDFRAAPAKGDIVRRGLRKLGRIPGAVARRVRSRMAR